MNEKAAHEGLERFAKSNGISYKHARAEMIEGDADAGWRHLEYARDNKDKAERACVLLWLQLLEQRGKLIVTDENVAAIESMLKEIAK